MSRDETICVDDGCPHCGAPGGLHNYGCHHWLTENNALIERLTRELADMTADYLRRHNDAVDRMEENIALKAENEKLRGALAIARVYVWDELVGSTLVAKADEPVSKWPTLRKMLDDVLGTRTPAKESAE